MPDLHNETDFAVPDGSGKKRKRTITASSASKRKKAADGRPSASTSATGAQVEEDARPRWIINSHDLFKSVELGEEWRALVANWLKLEEDAQFVGNSKLGTYKRPGLITD